MIIGGYQAFVNLVGNDSYPGIEKLNSCIAMLRKICKCQKHKRVMKSEECENIYVDIVKTTANQSIDYFKTKTSDEHITFNYGGIRKILTLKLR